MPSRAWIRICCWTWPCGIIPTLSVWEKCVQRRHTQRRKRPAPVTVSEDLYSLEILTVIAPGISGNVLPLYAFESVWPPMRYVLAASLLLFSTTSLMSQWYFGFVGLNYMFGRTVAEKFKYIFPCFCIFGATLKSDMVWTIQDIALGLLTIPNLIAMIFLWPKVRKATKEFFGPPRT